MAKKSQHPKIIYVDVVVYDNKLGRHREFEKKCNTEIYDLNEAEKHQETLINLMFNKYKDKGLVELDSFIMSYQTMSRYKFIKRGDDGNWHIIINKVDKLYRIDDGKEESNMGNTIKAFENAKPATKGKNGSYFLKLHLYDTNEIVLLNPLFIAYIIEDIKNDRTIISLTDGDTKICVKEEILDINMMLELEMGRFRMETEE